MVFSVLDVLDVLLCFLYKFIDFLVEAEWKPCYCSSAKEAITSSDKILVSEQGKSKIVCLYSSKLQLEDISNTLSTRSSLVSEISKSTATRVKELKRLKSRKVETLVPPQVLSHCKLRNGTVRSDLSSVSIPPLLKCCKGRLVVKWLTHFLVGLIVIAKPAILGLLLARKPCLFMLKLPMEFWASVGCSIMQCSNTEVGAGTMNPLTFLRVLGPEPWNVAWWKELDLGEKLPYARDCVVECYLCGMEMNFLPEFSNGRIMLGKLINLLAVIDDTYDTYGTLEEMELFTDAIHRWDIKAMDQLPEYLRLLYHALYKLVNESNYMSMKHRENNGIYYFKKMLQDMCNAFMQEARWFNDGHTPSMEEYLSISLTTAGGVLASIVAALVMGDMVDKEGLDYIVEDSTLPKLVTTITRLLDDIGTFKFEEKGGDVTKSIECYMIEHGVSQEVAYTHIKNLIAKAWKDINQELLNRIPLPKPVAEGIINYAKGSEVFYLNGNDGFGNSQSWFKDTVDFMLFEPIPL